MKKLRKIIVIILVLLALITSSIVIYGFYLRPQYEGELVLKGISKETTVYFDEYGIPHIYASNQKDAMQVLGYVHAQDCLWQMELLRRIAQENCLKYLVVGHSKTIFFLLA